MEHWDLVGVLADHKEKCHHMDHFPVGHKKVVGCSFEEVGESFHHWIKSKDDVVRKGHVFQLLRWGRTYYWL